MELLVLLAAELDIQAAFNRFEDYQDRIVISAVLDLRQDPELEAFR